MIRKALFAAMTALCTFSVLFAQDYATVKCTITNPLRDFVVMEKVIQPVTKKDTIKLDAKNSFTFKTEELEELQAYRLNFGDRKTSGGAIPTTTGTMVQGAYFPDKVDLMLNKGFNLLIIFDAQNKDNTLKITGKGKDLSIYHQEREKVDMAFQQHYPSLMRTSKDTMVYYVDKYEKDRLALLAKFLPLLKPIKGFSVADEKKILKYGTATRRCNYAGIMINRYKNDSIISVFDDKYFGFLKNIPFNDDNERENRHYTIFIRNYVNYLLAKQNKGSRINDVESFQQRYDIYKSLFKTETLRDFQLFEMLSYYNAKAREKWYQEAVTDFNSIAKSDSLKYEINNILLIRQKMGKGLPAYNFTVYNRDGKPHSLADFKGEYVLIDVWATWCKPCVYEIPFLEKLEKDMAGKPIKFVSISVDDDSTRWRKFLDRKGMHGNQFWNGNNKDHGFYKEFLVQGIPRFIFIDREGNFVDPNAPRPSTPDLFTLFRQQEGLKSTTPSTGPQNQNTDSN